MIFLSLSKLRIDSVGSVWAQWSGDEYKDCWYLTTVKAINKDGTYDIIFPEGTAYLYNLTVALFFCPFRRGH